MYDIADKISRDLAEDVIAADMSEMMVPRSKEAASHVRGMCERNENYTANAVQDYGKYRRAIYSAICDLFEGDQEYVLVKADYLNHIKDLVVEQEATDTWLTPDLKALHNAIYREEV